MIDVTHSELVSIAAKWLAKKCAVVITELNTVGECPDAIGWQGNHSTLIECKVSRNDFLKDKNKSFRFQRFQGVGLHRLYLAPKGIIEVSELPKGWGLLELLDGKVRQIKPSDHFEDSNHRHEINLLLSSIRRIGRNSPVGVSVKFYTIDSRNTATLGVNLEP